MFEIVELGSKLAKRDYEQQLPELRTRLLQLQNELREANIPLLIIVAGVEGAGKGALVSRLNEWMDARGIQTHALWDESDEESERPYFWRFWRRLPPRGRIGIFFGSWYTRMIVDRVFDVISDVQLQRQVAQVEEIERMLSDDGMLILKFWLHLSAADQQRAFAKDKASGLKVGSTKKRYAKRYEIFQKISAHIVRQTDTGYCPWTLVDACDRRHRELTVANAIIRQGQARLAQVRTQGEQVSSTPELALALPDAVPVTVLDKVDLKKSLDGDAYKKKLAKYQTRLHGLAWEALRQKRSVIALFEGWDASGKGSAIRRVSTAVDARLCRVIPFAAPTDEEKARHYLWRFWRHIPRSGYISLYDRSWYGRVLVERVEGFAGQDEWRRAYQEINDFESQLHEHGIIVMKFWIHIDPEEQLRRFQERERIPWKRYKITAEDYRNRDKWPDYALAVNDMVAHTSTSEVPWTLVPGNSKKYARIEILKTFCKTLSDVLNEK